MADTDYSLVDIALAGCANWSAKWVGRTQQP